LVVQAVSCPNALQWDKRLAAPLLVKAAELLVGRPDAEHRDEKISKHPD